MSADPRGLQILMDLTIGQSHVETNHREYGTESVTKYKCSILQTEQNTTKRNKIQHDKIQKCQNTNTTKYKRTKYKLPKYKCKKIQM